MFFGKTDVLTGLRTIEKNIQKPANNPHRLVV